jgi:hypothetical protein
VHKFEDEQDLQPIINLVQRTQIVIVPSTEYCKIDESLQSEHTELPQPKQFGKEVHPTQDVPVES